MKTKESTNKNWIPLIELIPSIERTENFGEFIEPTKISENFTLYNGFNNSRIVDEFIHRAYENGLIYDFDWMSWDYGKSILENKFIGTFENFDLDILNKFIITIVRNDKYCDGYLISKFSDGTVLKILKSVNSILNGKHRHNNFQSLDYTIHTHIHNYAIWTAARAVQRNFTNTETIQDAINNTDLENFIYTKNEMSEDSYDKFHRKTANNIIDFITDKGIKTSYGQAAKIIAIYLKTAIVIRDNKSPIAKVAHPPIDSILLSNLNKNYSNLKLFGIRWTQLNEEKYFVLINKLRSLKLEYFWEIEKYWTPIKK